MVMRGSIARDVATGGRKPRLYKKKKSQAAASSGAVAAVGPTSAGFDESNVAAGAVAITSTPTAGTATAPMTTSATASTVEVMTQQWTRACAAAEASNARLAVMTEALNQAEARELAWRRPVVPTEPQPVIDEEAATMADDDEEADCSAEVVRVKPAGHRRKKRKA